MLPIRSSTQYIIRSVCKCHIFPAITITITITINIYYESWRLHGVEPWTAREYKEPVWAATEAWVPSVRMSRFYLPARQDSHWSRDYIKVMETKDTITCSTWWSLQAMMSALHSTDCASNLMAPYLTLCPILLISLSCKSVILTMGT